MQDLKNIPKMLRKTARDIEAGLYGKPSAAVLLMRAGRRNQAFGFGNAAARRALKLLDAGRNIIKRARRTNTG